MDNKLEGVSIETEILLNMKSRQLREFVYYSSEIATNNKEIDKTIANYKSKMNYIIKLNYILILIIILLILVISIYSNH